MKRIFILKLILLSLFLCCCSTSKEIKKEQFENVDSVQISKKDSFKVTNNQSFIDLYEEFKDTSKVYNDLEISVLEYDNGTIKKEIKVKKTFKKDNHIFKENETIESNTSKDSLKVETNDSTHIESTKVEKNDFERKFNKNGLCFNLFYLLFLLLILGFMIYSITKKIKD